LSDDIDSRVATVLSEIFTIPAESVGPDTSTETIEQWDSLQHLTVILSLEEEFDIQLDDDEAVQVTSFPVIIDVVRRHLGAVGQN
jgi:acyl carrier protein